MNEIIHIETIAEMLKMLPNTTVEHPLVTVIDFSKYQEQFNSGMKITLGFYTVMFKNSCVNKMKYGQQSYDFQNGSLICIAPKQVITLDEPIKNTLDVKGWGLFFHPDLIRGTSLGSKMKDYSFFNYEVNEALHLSDKEKQTLNDSILKIENEVSQKIDNHSQTLIVSNIELLLNYCSRYYDRQFITRKNNNSDLLIRFENILKQYFSSNNLKDKGLPSVKYLAEHLYLSQNYLSDLLKKETGKNAQDHIHTYIIEEAKNSLLNSNATIGEIAFQLGFDYPQYFSKLFKTKTGMTPIEFRNLN
jgi:AraC-like DNA-binding protein